MSSAVSVPESEKRSRYIGAAALIRPQTAKHNANETVDRTRCRARL
jgi:hypothetical protein